MKCGDAGKRLIRDFEGLYLEPYICPTGHWTVGYGHREFCDTFRHLGFTLTKTQCDKLLDFDLRRVEWDVIKLLKAPVTQLQFDAICSFTFNLGSDIDDDNIAEGLVDSTLLKKLNAKDYKGAAQEFLKWINGTDPKTKAKKPMEGLLRRRNAERELFLEGTK